MADKDPEGILSLLEPLLAEVVVTRASNTRALEVEDLAEVAIDIFGEDRVHVAERLERRARPRGRPARRARSSAGAGVLVTGSILLVAEARRLLGRP